MTGDDLTDRELPRFPVGFNQWPREERVRYLTQMRTREELLAEIRSVIDSERSSERLDVRELAEVAERFGAGP